MSARILVGDCLDSLKTLPAGSVQCCVTSPPYWGLRDYGQDGQHGLEETPAAYVANLVRVFAEVRRVLRNDGTVWLNLGDSYASGGMSNPSDKSTLGGGKDRGAADYSITRAVPTGLKTKDLVGIPWRVAFALQADGWYLRSDIIWHKPNPMPESVRDRPTKGHEYVFLLSKRPRYFYDADAVREKGRPSGWDRQRRKGVDTWKYNDTPERREAAGDGNNRGGFGDMSTRNRRTVWSIPSKPYTGAHFATMPPELARLCILAGSMEGSTVLDPYAGAGTTGLVAAKLRRDFIGCELSPEYAALAESRLWGDAPLFADVAVE